MSFGRLSSSCSWLATCSSASHSPHFNCPGALPVASARACQRACQRACLRQALRLLSRGWRLQVQGRGGHVQRGRRGSWGRWRAVGSTRG